MPDDYNAIADRALPGLRRAVLRILNGWAKVPPDVIEPLVSGGYPAVYISALVPFQTTYTAGVLYEQLARLTLRSMNAEAKRIGPLRFADAFTTINAETIAFLERYALALVTDLEADVRANVKAILIRGAQEGWPVRLQAKAIAEAIGLNPRQELAMWNVQRTVYEQALADGRTIAQAEAAAAKAMEKARVRMVKYRATTIARTECLIGDSVIDNAVVRAVFRRPYDGPIVEVVTSAGRKLSTTPNHPMLTRRGWVPAELITEGDDLVCYHGEQNAGAPGDEDVQHGPTTIAEIFDSLAAVGVVERERTGKPDFHGDGAEGEVDILSPNRPLVIGRFAPLYQPVANGFLSPSDDVASAEFCQACGRLLSIDKQPCGCRASTGYATFREPIMNHRTRDAEFASQLIGGFPGLIAARNLSSVDVFAELVVAASVREMELPSVAQRASNASVLDDIANPPSVCSHGGGDLPGAQPGQIEFDRVCSVSIRPFSGHVYNLSTPYGYFTHNAVYTGNTIRSQNAGQQAVWDQYQREGLLPMNATKVWIVTPDDRLCKRCRPLDGQEAPLNGEFSTDVGWLGYPPLHSNCRCAVSIGRA